MTALSATLPPCPVPGCRSATDRVGRPCSECLAAFGDAIHEVPDRQIDPEEFLRIQREGDDQVRLILAQRAIATREADDIARAGEVRRHNQTCWICEQRRLCLLTQQGWECRSCQQEA